MKQDGVKIRTKIHESLREKGAIFLSGDEFGITQSHTERASMLSIWQNLPLDPHIPAGPLARRRTHARFLFEHNNSHLTRLPQAPYFQSRESNSVYGGSERTFHPTDQTFFDDHLPIPKIIETCAAALPCKYDKVLINCHFMRIFGSTDAPGEPSPEGIHRDGFDFVSLHLVNRKSITAGQSIVVDNDLNIVEAPLMNRVFDTLVIDETRCKHAGLPFFVEDEIGFRDMILCSYEQFIQ